MAKFLVTGGAGYIGSHTCVELLNAGHEVVVLDNLCNSAAESLNRVQQLTQKSLTFIQGDIRDTQLLDQVFQQYSIDAVIHFAGLKAVGESQQIPLAYFDNNITGSISLVQAMQRAQVFKLVFSSSATVYGENNPSPYQEDMLLGMPNNNYGYTKLIVEQLLEKLSVDLGLNYQPNEKGNDVFDVAVSTQMFNNRVVVNGSVGNKQYTENVQTDVVGDLDIEIKLNKSGALRLNLFSHSADSYTNYLDNSQRNGIGLTYQTEFSSFKQWVKNILSKRMKRLAAKQAEEEARAEEARVELKIE